MIEALTIAADFLFQFALWFGLIWFAAGCFGVNWRRLFK